MPVPDYLDIDAARMPEYIDSTMLHDIVTLAGKVNGLADFRPTYGRFNVIRFEVEG